MRLIAVIMLLATCAIAAPPQAFVNMWRAAAKGDDIPRQNLQAEWLFMDDLLDTSGNSNHLETLVNVPTNGVLYFAGGVNSFARTQNTNFLLGATELTVSFWAKANDENQNWFFMWQATNANAVANRGGLELQWRPTLTPVRYYVVTYVKGGSPNDTTSHTNDAFFADHTNWTHYAVTKVFGATPRDQLLFINSNPVSYTIDVSTGPTNVPQNPLYIGNNEAATNVRRYRGYQGRWRVYDRALTAEEIQSLYNEGPPE